MNWRWTARRLAISAFLACHLFALVIINLPNSAIRQRFFPVVIYYLLPIGLDQAWGMFAPNPVMHATMMEVLTVDKKGIQRTYAFPKMTDFTLWQAIPRVRHSKFTSNCGMESSAAHREFAVRYAIRQLKIPADVFPVDAELYFQVFETPPPGAPPRDPMTPPVHLTLKNYRYPSMAEVMP